MGLWKYIRSAMLKYPDQTISDGNISLTYIEIIERAEELSGLLLGKKCCGILCSTEINSSICLLACFISEVTAVPMAARYGNVHSERIIRTIEPTCVITDTDGGIVVTDLPNGQYKEPEQHPALIMCTSGTTGSPKGVMLAQRSILTNVRDISEYFNIDSSDTILISRPLYHCSVITGEFLLSLVKGARIVFYSGKFNPKTLLDLIKSEKITVFCGTPTMLELMARTEKDPSELTLKKISISGEHLTASAAEVILKIFGHADVYNVYGLTEACPRVSYLPPYLIRKYPTSVGFPLRSVSIRIVKQDGSPAGCFEEGILWVKGDNVMLGYYNDPEMTEKVIKDGWLCTGDVASKGPYSMLRILGRSDDMIIKAGMNIYPLEIEEALKYDSRVREVIAYGYKGFYGVNQIGLRISGDFKDISEVKKLCTEVLPDYQVPSRIELLDELPKNGTGKIIRRIACDRE